MNEYVVTIRFQFPAYDEKNGIRYREVYAKSKADAIASIRRKARNDGHTGAGAGKGRATFTAEEVESPVSRSDDEGLWRRSYDF